MSEEQVDVVVDLEATFKEFQEYRAEHPGSMSANALKVWVANGKKDRDNYKWKAYTKRKRKRSGTDLREKLEDGRKAKKDKSGPSNIVHNHYY